MKNRLMSVIAWSTAAICLTAPQNVLAQGGPARDTVKIDFSTPLMVPGATLPAGTYIFKLTDSRTNRHIVQIWDASQSRVLATAFAIPARRTDPKGDIVVTFSRTPSPNLPPALKSYFYPGDRIGHELIYGEDEARRISEQAKTAVLSHDVKDGKREGWEKATIKLWDQGMQKPYTEGRATSGQD